MERTGAEHVSLPHDADFDDRDLEGAFPDRARKHGLAALAFDIEHVFVRPARGQYSAVVELVAANQADVVLIDPTFAGGAYFSSLDASERPPVVVAGVLPLPLSSVDTAPFGMGIRPSHFMNQTRNQLLTVASRRVIGPAQKVAEATHLDLHGRPMPGEVLDWMRRVDGIAQFTVPEFEYPRSDAPDHLRFVGPLPAPSVGAIPDWWGDLDSGQPIVHVTQGTIANMDFSQLVGPTLEAMAEREVLVVVATGGRALSELPALPANARAAEFLPYDQLLPRTSVYVTNGGYGGVNLALRHGVPIVVTGGKEDKPEVGARIQWTGVGRRLRAETPSVRALSRAIDDVLASSDYRFTAREMAAAMEDADGLAGIARVIDDVIAERQR